MADQKDAGKVDLTEKAAAKPAAKVPPPKVLIPKGPHAEHPRQRITAEKIATMQKPEILAVATDRGYDLGKDFHSLGRAALALRFLQEQDKEKDLH